MERQKAEERLISQTKLLLKQGETQDARECIAMIKTPYTRPDEISTLKGIVCMLSGKFEEAQAEFISALENNPNHAVAHDNLCAALVNGKRFTEAINHVDKLPKNMLYRPNLIYNYALALHQLERYDEAEQQLRKCLENHPLRVDARHLLAKVQIAKGNFGTATKLLFEIWNENPRSEIASDLGVSLSKSGDHESATNYFNLAIEHDPLYAPAHLNLAAIHLKCSRYTSIKLTEKIVQKFPLQLRGRGFFLISQMKAGLRLFNEARIYSEKALSVAPKQDRELITIRLMQYERQAGIFDHTYDQINKALDQALSSSSELVVSPFVAINLIDEPEIQLRTANKYSGATQKKEHLQREANSRIRIGYITGDFYDHATLFLMQGLLRHHDKSRFEVYVYDFNVKESESASKREALKHIDLYSDITAVSDQDVADMIQQHNIDIVVDLKGYTEGHRFGIFKLSKAALTVSFLGYPGTSGSSVIDYLIADSTVIPKEYRRYYSERIIFLPNTYQPTDDQRSISESKSTRQDHGLPEKPHVVLACFHNILKISSAEIKIWTEILIEHPNTVLWMLDQEDVTKSNIYKTFATKGIQPRRILFAPFLPQQSHLERLSHCDIALDTWAYNAHTSASDALWANIPLVTLKGKQFAARVAASILTAVGLNELVASSPQQYKKLICELIVNETKRNRIQTYLKTFKKQTPLFNSKSYARNFEKGLVTALTDKSNGRSKDIYVKDQKFD